MVMKFKKLKIYNLNLLRMEENLQNAQAYQTKPGKRKKRLKWILIVL